MSVFCHAYSILLRPGLIPLALMHESPSLAAAPTSEHHDDAYKLEIAKWRFLCRPGNLRVLLYFIQQIIGDNQAATCYMKYEKIIN